MRRQHAALHCTRHVSTSAEKTPRKLLVALCVPPLVQRMQPAACEKKKKI